MIGLLPRLHRPAFIRHWHILSLISFTLIVGVVGSGVSNKLQDVFEPACIIPGIRYSSWCDTSRFTVRCADFKSSMAKEIARTALERPMWVAEKNSGSLNGRKVQQAVKDLAELVRGSNLRQKDLLAATLTEFADGAKAVGGSLMNFDERLQGTLDRVVAVNDYAVKTIEGAEDNMPPEWFPDALVPGCSRTSINTALEETFASGMSVLSTSAQKLILDAEERRSDLEELQDKLDVVYNIIVNEDVRIKSGQADLRSNILARLWTFLGGNKRKIRNFDEQLRVLMNVGRYREEAMERVVGAIQTLHHLTADLEVLRERVAMPALAGDAIPLSVHVRGIQETVQSLRQGSVSRSTLQKGKDRNRVGV